MANLNDVMRKAREVYKGNGAFFNEEEIKMLAGIAAGLEEQLADLKRVFAPIIDCECDPSTPTPWICNNIGKISGKAEYETQFPDDEGDRVFQYCDEEVVAECYYNNRSGVNPDNGKAWSDKENEIRMAHANETAIINAVNVVVSVKAAYKKWEAAKEVQG